MAILHVRNVPENLYELIRRQAQEQNRSISAQVVHLLERAVLESPQAQGEILELTRRRRSLNPERVGAPDSLSLIRQDRDRRLILILGGARSGKSACAEKLALEHSGSVTYVATAQALDEEMAARIAQHQRDRPGGWQTREIPTGVGAALTADPPQTDVILVDCLTLLVSNLLMQTTDHEGEVDEKGAAGRVESEIEGLLEAIQSIPAVWIMVSNEVGLGLVPPYPLGRAYRDLLGRVNQRLAAQAEQVIFMVAGIPMRLTPQ